MHAIRTFGYHNIELNDVQILQRAHDMAVSIGVFFRSVCGREGAGRVEGVARRTQVLDGLCARVRRRVRDLPTTLEYTVSILTIETHLHVL